MNEKVSIIIPVYKNINFLNMSLSSAVNQTYKNIEIILIDDGNSKEDIKKIYLIKKKFKKRNIKIIHLKNNKGVGKALNEGIRKSKGQYISWLSHDDYFHFKKIEMQMRYLKKKNAKICSCDFIEINKIKNYRLSRILDQNYFEDQVFSIILNDSMHGCSLLIKKTCFSKNLFNEKYKHIQDYDLWNKLSERYLIVHLKRKLLYSSKHIRQTSYVKKDESIIEKVLFYEKLIERKLLVYDFKQFKYILKFILRSIVIYNSPSLAMKVFSRFFFYKYFNYLKLYLTRN